MSRWIYSKADGSVHIVVGAKKEDLERSLGMLTDQQYEKHILSKSIPEDALNVRKIKDEEIPHERYFRSAWIDKGRIEIDMKKARVVHLNNLRIIRNKMLSELDVKFSIAFEKNDGYEEIALKKQKLRDMPINYSLENFNTPEELKNFIPDILLPEFISKKKSLADLHRLE